MGISRDQNMLMYHKFINSKLCLLPPSFKISNIISDKILSGSFISFSVF